MTKLSTHLVALAALLGATAVLATTSAPLAANPIEEARFASDGAFRDGLYLGKLAASSDQSQHPAIGRWSRAEDRSMFTAGYRRGYDEGHQLAAVAQ